ncbi:MAG: class I mannose-6-phosphate isomerase [Paludibacteraceae bacterium]|nr:class I mannose-6-phosphate isomerase [Paludibacteraceae bacterium]
MLYPLKFEPILKQRIWGGTNLKKLLHKNYADNQSIGESWELSGMLGDESVVVNGSLAGNTLNELLEVYMDELLGSKVFEKYGTTFPLLFKFIASNDDLSIQVHPSDELAEKQGSFGKTEMWYVLDAEEGAELVLGFNQKMDKASCLAHIENNTLESVLNRVKVKKGDVFYIPAGMVHAIGKGILLIEVQQASDITYRLYDYGRIDNNGQTRQLHIQEALEAIDFENHEDAKIEYQLQKNGTTPLVSCDYFSVNLLSFDKPITKDYTDLDSFVVYMCIEGSLSVQRQGRKETIKKGETVLMPVGSELQLLPNVKSQLLEICCE